LTGFARRYFVLYHTGLLQYSVEPGQLVRDQISLPISTAPGRKDIHIDSNTATFHIKCLSTEDFNMWMTAFRKFISTGSDARRSLSSRKSARNASISLGKSESLAESMVPLIDQLEESILALLQELSSKKMPSLSKKSEKDRHKDHRDTVFNLFKRHPHHHPGDFGTDISPLDLPPAAQHILKLLEQLKSHNAALLQSLQSRLVNESSTIYHSPLPPTTEENVHDSPEQTERPLEHHRRHSVATTISDGNYEWHDAVDTMNDGPEDQSSLEPLDQSADETDLEEETGQPTLRLAQGTIQDNRAILRRSQLPSRVIGDEGSLFAVLKKNIGKDLSTITLPVTFNEPLTLLERLAEEVEYHNLLDEAACTNDPVDRLSYVAAFAVSGYAHTRHRSGRKGFNPMLAETFEDIRIKFIAEKVRHHPVELAYHAEGDDWELTATSAGRTKFWGKSLEIIPQGITRLRIGDDHFSWTRPSSFMRNLVVGTKYLEHCGDLTIENHTNGFRCVLEFKQNGYWGPSNIVSGHIYSQKGVIASQLEGKWDDQISQALDPSHFRLLWRMNPFPNDSQDYYGFTTFGITLNEITPDLVGKLPPTDSRLRPDVQALEKGEVDEAEIAKHKIEEMQRDRRRQGQERQPRWFKQVDNEWVYAGGYWEARARNWRGENMQPLW
ncbi:Oxysterol-binding protein-related protein 3, partial [Leucoagaricus sp. SymC.cos]